MKVKNIRANYGPNGIKILVKTKNHFAEITDDTQMTMFTAEGLLRAEARTRKYGTANIPEFVYKSYLRWLITQGYCSSVEKDGWLIKLEDLYDKRGPGVTCLNALNSGQMGSITAPLNDSKGCGAVMRTAPIGLFFNKEKAFFYGNACAAITHGHPSGYLSAGTLSYIIAAVIDGDEIETATYSALTRLKEERGHEEVSQAIRKAINLTISGQEDIKAIESIGEGWVGEEALAISLYSALKYKDNFEKALIVAVNHSGDSDSIGAITGNILGAYIGINNIRKQLVDAVEFSKELIQLADDLWKRYEETNEWEQKYPT